MDFNVNDVDVVVKIIVGIVWLMGIIVEQGFICGRVSFGLLSNYDLQIGY